MNALLSLAPDARDAAAVERDNLPLGERFAETGGNTLRHSRRHDPFGVLPSTDDVIALGLELSGFSDPQTLSHTRPIELLLGAAITGLQTLTNCDRDLISVKFA